MSATLTLELDDADVLALQGLSESWHLPAQEAIKRAVTTAAQGLPPAVNPQLAAFRRLQESAGVSPAKAAEWKRSVSDARR